MMTLDDQLYSHIFALLYGPTDFKNHSQQFFDSKPYASEKEEDKSQLHCLKNSAKQSEINWKNCGEWLYHFI